MARETIFDRLSTPAQLENYVLGVKKGFYQSLVVVGRGGTGKSTVVRKFFPENEPIAPVDLTDSFLIPEEPIKHRGAYWCKGRVSPVRFYEHLWTYRDCSIVLDDAPNLARNLPLAGLLRQLCETEDTRTISWDTQNPNIGGEGQPPRSFRTTSKFILLTNRWMDRHEEVEALETRTPIVKYDPSADLIHSQAVAAMRARLRDTSGLRFEPAVVSYVEKAMKAGRVHTINLRDYIIAGRKYRNGDVWRTTLYQQILPSEEVAEDMPSDPEYILDWAIRKGHPVFTAGTLYRRTKRFRGEKAEMLKVLHWMVEKKMLICRKPMVVGPTRSSGMEYVLPAVGRGGAHQGTRAPLTALAIRKSYMA